MTTLHHLYHSLRALPLGWWLAIICLSSLVSGVIGFVIGDLNALCNECASERDLHHENPFAPRH